MSIPSKSSEPQSYGLRGRVIQRAKFLVGHDPFLERIDGKRQLWNEAFPRYSARGVGAPNYHDPGDALYFPPGLHSAVQGAKDGASMLELMPIGNAWHQMVRAISMEFWPVEDFSRHHILDLTAGFVTACLVYQPRTKLADLISREALTLRQSWWDPFDLTWAVYRTYDQITSAIALFGDYVPREVLEQIRDSMVFRLGEEELQRAYEPLMSSQHGSFRYVPVPETFLKKDWDSIRSKMDTQWPNRDGFLERRASELISQGLSPQDVAERLGITKDYLGQILAI